MMFITNTCFPDSLFLNLKNFRTYNDFVPIIVIFCSYYSYLHSLDRKSNIRKYDHSDIVSQNTNIGMGYLQSRGQHCSLYPMDHSLWELL